MLCLHVLETYLTKGNQFAHVMVLGPNVFRHVVMNQVPHEQESGIIVALDEQCFLRSLKFSIHFSEEHGLFGCKHAEMYSASVDDVETVGFFFDF